MKPNVIADRIKELEQVVGWSENQLAKRAGMSPSKLEKIIKYEIIPSLNTIEKLCQAFGLPLSEFFSTSSFGYKFHELDNDSRDLIYLFNCLKDLEKEAVLKFMRYLKNTQF